MPNSQRHGLASRQVDDGIWSLNMRLPQSCPALRRVRCVARLRHACKLGRCTSPILTTPRCALEDWRCCRCRCCCCDCFVVQPPMDTLAPIECYRRRSLLHAANSCWAPAQAPSSPRCGQWYERRICNFGAQQLCLDKGAMPPKRRPIPTSEQSLVCLIQVRSWHWYIEALKPA